MDGRHVTDLRTGQEVDSWLRKYERKMKTEDTKLSNRNKITVDVEA